MIGRVCLTYLNFQCVQELSLTLSSTPPTVPLVGYASCYWGKYIKKEQAGTVNLLALGLLVQFQ